jgi:hypothetical protein
MVALHLQSRCRRAPRNSAVIKEKHHMDDIVGTSMLYMSESLSKTSSMVGRSAGSVIHGSSELSLLSAAGIRLGLDGTVPVRQHSSIRVTNAAGNVALHKNGMRESPAIATMHIAHLFDQREGKPRVLRDNLRRNLLKQLASVSVSVSGVCVWVQVCVCVRVCGCACAQVLGFAEFCAAERGC